MPTERSSKEAREITLWWLGDDNDDLTEKIAAALDAARAEEREACAEIVEGMIGPGLDPQGSVAEAIRARAKEAGDG